MSIIAFHIPKGPPPPPSRKRPPKQLSGQSSQAPEEQSEETSYESLRSKLHDAASLLVEALAELDQLEQQSKTG